MNITRPFFVFLVVFTLSGCGSFGTFGSENTAVSAAPATPLKVRATPVTGAAGTIQIDWLPQPTANIHYTVFESTHPEVSPASYDGKKPDIQDPPISFTGLTPGITYYFVVTTDDNFQNLESPPSTPVASAIAP
jgi:hypothetical protein